MGRLEGGGTPSKPSSSMVSSPASNAMFTKRHNTEDFMVESTQAKIQRLESTRLKLDLSDAAQEVHRTATHADAHEDTKANTEMQETPRLKTDVSEGPPEPPTHYETDDDVKLLLDNAKAIRDHVAALSKEFAERKADDRELFLGEREELDKARSPLQGIQEDLAAVREAAVSRNEPLEDLDAAIREFQDIEVEVAHLQEAHSGVDAVDLRVSTMDTKEEVYELRRQLRALERMHGKTQTELVQLMELATLVKDDEDFEALSRGRVLQGIDELCGRISTIERHFEESDKLK